MLRFPPSWAVIAGPNRASQASKIFKITIPLLPQILGIRLPIIRLIVVLIEIPRVGRTSEVWDYRTGRPPMINGVPVDIPEPLVLFDSCGAALNVAETFGGVDGAEAADERAGVLRHG
jgi:hypothetical protein